LRPGFYGIQIFISLTLSALQKAVKISYSKLLMIYVQNYSKGVESLKNKIKCKNVLKAVENHWKTLESMGNAQTWFTYILEYCSK
jgi:hypothetical protein